MLTLNAATLFLVNGVWAKRELAEPSVGTRGLMSLPLLELESHMPRVSNSFLNAILGTVSPRFLEAAEIDPSHGWETKDHQNQGMPIPYIHSMIVWESSKVAVARRSL